MFGRFGRKKPSTSTDGSKPGLATLLFLSSGLTPSPKTAAILREADRGIDRRNGNQPPREAPESFTVGVSAPDKPFIRDGDIASLTLPPGAYICNSCGVLGLGTPVLPDPLTVGPNGCLTCGNPGI